ncbi:MAG: pyridoxal-phosphate-dependent aminotransferase family protein [Lachnospiraceae bacterium]
MINFTVGPVMESEEVLEIGRCQTPYFRNQSFSKIMLENEAMMKELTFAPKESRAVFLTSSGTGAMEATVMNCFNKDDKVLVIDGGIFGHRFVQLCEIHNIPHTVIKVAFDELLTESMLNEYDNQGYTGFLINMHETSIGKLYDMTIVSEFCKRNDIFLVVDAISAFLADPINISELCIDVMITGSQKALAVPPGISILVLSEKAIKRIDDNKACCMYFNLKDALENGERGQTPFTPAVSILIQINKRLDLLCEYGVEVENKRIRELAYYFRDNIEGLPLKIASPSMSNAVTPLMLTNGKSAYELFEILERDYGVWVCPSGGELKDKLIRVGHIGDIKKQNVDYLISSLNKIL